MIAPQSGSVGAPLQGRGIPDQHPAIAGGDDAGRSQLAQRFLQRDLSGAAHGGQLVLGQANVNDDPVGVAGARRTSTG
jgi:hypothetical protein